MTNLGHEWSFSDRSKHSDTRQSTLSNRGNTLSRVTMLYAGEASTVTRICGNTLSAVRVLPQICLTSYDMVKSFSSPFFIALGYVGYIGYIGF